MRLISPSIPVKGNTISWIKRIIKRITFFPVPTGTSKGILVLGSTHGNVLVGPNSISGEDKEDMQSRARDWRNLVFRGETGARNLRAASLQCFRGCAPQAMLAAAIPKWITGTIFVIEPSEHLHGVIHLAGIESPGLTAAPAIALRVVDILKDAGEILSERRTGTRSGFPSAL